VSTKAKNRNDVSELESLRAWARQLLRSYGPYPHRIQELLRIEARHRHLRDLLRKALGEAEPSDTRERRHAELRILEW
jgi:hypothetical protein